MSGPAQLFVYRFGSEAAFEGHLVGALERIESGGALRVLDVLFVSSDAASGEISAIDLHGSSAGGMIGPLIGFRLDVAERRRSTRRILGSGLADLITAIGEALEPGAALVAVLVGHEWSRVLDDAVARTGGTEVARPFVEATSFAGLATELLDAAASAPAR